MITDYEAVQFQSKYPSLANELIFAGEMDHAEQPMWNEVNAELDDSKIMERAVGYAAKYMLKNKRRLIKVADWRERDNISNEAVRWLEHEHYKHLQSIRDKLGVESPPYTPVDWAGQALQALPAYRTVSVTIPETDYYLWMRAHDDADNKGQTMSQWFNALLREELG